MKLIKAAAPLTAILTLLVSTAIAQTQYQTRYQDSDRPWDRNISQLVARIDQRASRLETRIEQTLDQSQTNVQREENIKLAISDFRESASDYRTRYDRRQAGVADAQAVLERAARINWMMQRRQVLAPVQEDWRLLRADLDSLARAYRLNWDWEANGAPPDYDRGDGRYDRGGYDNGAAARLSGTFQLNTARSDDARLIVNRTVQSLPYSDRQRVSEALLRRLDSPERLAIERRGRTITMASSRAPQMTFEADGQEHTEQYGNSQRVSRVTATLVGDGLAINSQGDRASDFTVNFEPINGGRQLRVTKRLYSERLNEPIVVQSTYDQVSENARWDVYSGSSTYDGYQDGGRGYPDRRYDQGRSDYFVPDGTSLVGQLDTGLDTSRVQPGDRLSLTVVSPRQYEGARLEGTINQVHRSGRISGRAGFNLAFDTIRLRNGQTYRFEGTIDSVRTPNGETVNVDREGTLKDDSSQTGRTVTRTAIGSAVGAIIGAVAGGGKGAAIGAGVGAGAGAGSVFVQGRDDLELRSGTEMTIRASSPRVR